MSEDNNINHAKAVKRLKSLTLREAIDYSSSEKIRDTLSTEESVENHTSSNPSPDSKTQNVTNVVPGDSIRPEQRDLITSSELVRDIDDSTDPLLVTAYAKQMYAYFLAEEHRTVVRPYLHDQLEINAKMRAILVDWLCEVHHKWRLHPETLYLTVNIVDRYLAKKKATKKTLQLVGSCALFIASKYEEVYPTSVGDLVYVCDGAYDYNDVSEFFVFRLESFFPYELTLFFLVLIGRGYGREDAADSQLPNQHSDYL